MRRFAAAVALAFALAAPAARADDVILLENGREVRGRIVSETDAAVKIDIGGGTMTYRRAQIAEVRREKRAEDAAPEGGAPPAAPESRRAESALVYRDGERVGTRTFRVTQSADGWLFEEEVRRFRPDGTPAGETRTTERADLQFRPLTFQVRETDGVAEHRAVAGEMRAGRLCLTFSKQGDRERKEVVAPADARFPFAARELFLRDSKALGGKFECDVFDVAEGRFARLRMREGGARPVRLEDRSLVARVLVRTVGDAAGDAAGDRTEREWLAPDLSAVLAELAGPSTLAVSASDAAVARLRAGDTDRVTGPDSAARTRYADRERGWTIDKPDPTWTFEKPRVEGTGALLSVRNEPIFASVDVLLDRDARRDVTPESAAESLQRLCRSIAPDFSVTRDGWLERDGRRVYWLDATATTRGEKTRTLARVVVKDGAVYRLLAACPAAAFDALRPDLEAVLDSFRLD